MNHELFFRVRNDDVIQELLLHTDTDDAKLLIGRKACDLVLDNPTVSGRHAQLQLYADKFFIADLGSLNRTSLNGEILPQRDFRELEAYSQLSFGEVEVELWIDRRPDREPTEVSELRKQLENTQSDLKAAQSKVSELSLEREESQAREARMGMTLTRLETDHRECGPRLRTLEQQLEAARQSGEQEKRRADEAERKLLTSSNKTFADPEMKAQLDLSRAQTVELNRQLLELRTELERTRAELEQARQKVEVLSNEGGRQPSSSSGDLTSLLSQVKPVVQEFEVALDEMLESTRALAKSQPELSAARELVSVARRAMLKMADLRGFLAVYDPGDET